MEADSSLGQCPVCGEVKQLSGTLPPRAVTAGIMAAATPTIKGQLDRAGAGLGTGRGVRCCGGCANAASDAADKAASYHPDVMELQRTKARSKDPVELSSPLRTSGGVSLVSAIITTATIAMTTAAQPPSRRRCHRRRCRRRCRRRRHYPPLPLPLTHSTHTPPSHRLPTTPPSYHHPTTLPESMLHEHRVGRDHG